ncbi:MAG: histidine--tRNA ligase [Elusimicrobiota bacterium]
MKYQALRGTRDIYLEEAEKISRLETAAKKVLQCYGFREIRTPVFEETAVFTRSIGEATDIVEKEMYTFQDRKGRSLSLRPEGTAGVVRALIEHNLLFQNPLLKLSYNGQMFRYERPQAGRYREFWQIGGELFGDGSAYSDAEIISCCWEIFNKIGLKGAVIQVNNVGCPECRQNYRQILVNHYTPLTTAICEDCRRRLTLNPMRLLDCKVEGCQTIKKDAPKISAHLCPTCFTHWQLLKKILKELQLPYQVNPCLVRGLDYYTRTTFEVKYPKLGSQDAIAAGGRYDNLVKEMGGNSVPATGFALGVERVIEALNLENIKLEQSKNVSVYFACLKEEFFIKCLSLVKDLRTLGIIVHHLYEIKSLKSHLRAADRLNADYAVLYGEEEQQIGAAIIRNLRTRTQAEIKPAEIISYFQKL